jgi:hypothetical protein
LRKTIAFGNNKGPVKRIYLAAGAAAQPEVLLLNGTTEERGFPPHIASKPFKACILLLPVGLDSFFYSKEWCCWEALCSSQEAVDGGSVAAQAAHNCCRRYSFLLLGHEPHFLRF